MRERQITKEYFAEVVEEQKDLMLRLAYSVLHNVADAEDAVSEAILKAWTKRNHLRDKGKMKNWLLRIVLNDSCNIIRRRRKEKLVEDAQSYIEKVTEMYEEEESGIWQLVLKLREEYRGVVVMHYYGELSVKEISKVLRIPEGTVKTRLHRARTELKDMWSQLGE
ncbi:MAG: sigma-70 family RNA polymerase sigma factor [Lachnospiraceae bacterium]|nr:sigma-70 family RNA polymerase sigma factor [Lachnospiraceae bacterium]